MNTELVSVLTLRLILSTEIKASGKDDGSENVGYKIVKEKAKRGTRNNKKRKQMRYF